MKNYLYLSNESKNANKYVSKDDIVLNNMRKCCIIPALNSGYSLYMGINRKYANEIKCTEYDIKFYDAFIYRNIFNFVDNYKAYKSLNKFLSNTKVDVIHCNTPIGGFVGRLCGHKHKVNKIIYTVHGFHFYKGAPLFNNTILKFAEKMMAHWTDVIITINQEDFEAAKKLKLKPGGKVYLVHGVGINVEEYSNILVDKEKKRKELGLAMDDFVLISVGDINANKNISLLIDIIYKMKNKRVKVIICGNGPLIDTLKKKALDLNIEKQIIFLGFRNDIKELYAISDAYISTSKREGLPRALMEAMASGLPCVVSNIRGNVDLIDDNKGGFLCSDINDYICGINNILNNDENRKLKCKYNLNKIKAYNFYNVCSEILQVYKEIFN